MPFGETMTLGNWITIIVLGIGGLGFVYTMRGQLTALSERMLGMETELKKLLDVLIQQGRHDERMNAMDSRIQSQGEWLDMLANRFNKVRNGDA